MSVGCWGCGVVYGEKDWPGDFVVSDEDWKKISPDGQGHGILCVSCMARRAKHLKLEMTGWFTSGPFAQDPPADRRDAFTRWLQQRRAAQERKQR